MCRYYTHFHFYRVFSKVSDVSSNQHKEISYEVAETYLSMLEMKLEKFRSKSTAITSLNILGDVDEKMLKLAEINKCNDYTLGALKNFAHFTLMYSKASISFNELAESFKSAVNELEMSPVSFIEKIASWACNAPDEGLINI